MPLGLALIWWLVATLLPAQASAEPANDQMVQTAQSTQGALANALAGISGARMVEDVARLSGPDFNGRQTGTADDLRSGSFVVERFQSLGLLTARRKSPQPGAQDWTLSGSVTVNQIGDHPALQLLFGPDSSSLRPGTDYLPILDSPSVNVTAPIVFVGYGISDPARGLDEYERLDVRNRVVLFLRGKPDKYAAPVTHADKERVAREKGAVAFLTATGPVLNAYEARRGISSQPMALYSQSEGERPLPGAWISTELAKRILAVEEHSLLEVQEQLNRARPQSFSTGLLARLAWESRQEPGMLHNVLGMIPGQDTGHGTDTLIVGAHRDHFGRQAGLLFPGADDNASGTAVLLEVARALIKSGAKPKRTILFVSFSGEEQGLFGSRLYVRDPPFPLADAIGMINVDHAGIGNGKLTVGITELPKEVATEAGRRAGLADLVEVFGFFPGGDHVPFKEAGVPTVTIVSSGAHPNFHQPSDRVETIQPEILERVARYVLALAWHLANAE